MTPDNKPGKIRTVLVVEDNETHMAYNAYLLKKLGFSVITANSGELALELLNKHQIDCMLLDINLGKGMSGLVLMEMLREKKEYREIPIAALTAYFGGGMHEVLLEKGFSDYLAKPFTINQLRELLSKYFPSMDLGNT
jgi:CheY-like chemotaxis protein